MVTKFWCFDRLWLGWEGIVEMIRSRVDEKVRLHQSNLSNPTVTLTNGMTVYVKGLYSKRLPTDSEPTNLNFDTHALPPSTLKLTKPYSNGRPLWLSRVAFSTNRIRERITGRPARWKVAELRLWVEIYVAEDWVFRDCGGGGCGSGHRHGLYITTNFKIRG